MKSLNFNLNSVMRIPDFSNLLFGGVLNYDAAGYYPGLELINLVFSRSDEKLLPSESEIFVKREALDFARKLVWDKECFPNHPKRENVLLDRNTEQTMSKLMECLQLEIPNVTKTPTWSRRHFFPYTQSLVHYDARVKKRTEPDNHHVEIERRYLRGGGALAFKVLRLDTNIKRREDNENGFSKLFEGTENGPLDRVVRVFRDCSHSDPDDRLSLDDIEKNKTTVWNDDLDDLYRDGVRNILSYIDFSSVLRTKALVNWTAIWVAILQSVRAERAVKDGTETSPFILDLANKNQQLRRASRSSLKDKTSYILLSLDNAVEQYNTLVSDDKEFKITNKGRNDIKGFFIGTCATVGLLNSLRGRKHFTLNINTLETLVMAGVPASTPMEFTDFTHNWLGKRCKLLIGKNYAEESGFLDQFDGAIFEDNEKKFSDHLFAAGLLKQYSDATKMVGLPSEE